MGKSKAVYVVGIEEVVCEEQQPDDLQREKLSTPS